MKRREFLNTSGQGVLAASTLSAWNSFAQTDPSWETIDVSPKLIELAKKEGSVTVRYSSPLDEMTVMANAFQNKFGIKVQIDRKVGVVGTQQFANEERAGQHLMDVNYSADPNGLLDLADEGLYLRFTLADLDKKLDKGTYLPGLAYGTKWT